MTGLEEQFVFGVDLDGVCADFYRKMRELVAYWRGVDEESLSENVSFGLAEWGMSNEEYERVHRFGVTQQEMFTQLAPITGCMQSLRRLSNEGVRIRIITHRLFINYSHRTAVVQTVDWLDKHAIPYWDLCFMKEKGHVDAHVYVDDSPDNIAQLQQSGKMVIAFSNSTNVGMDPAPHLRAQSWEEVEDLVRTRYYDWCKARRKPVPDSPGEPPPKVA